MATMILIEKVSYHTYDVLCGIKPDMEETAKYLLDGCWFKPEELKEILDVLSSYMADGHEDDHITFSDILMITEEVLKFSLDLVREQREKLKNKTA